MTDLREIIKIKAEKHHQYYQKLGITDYNSKSVGIRQKMAPQVLNSEQNEFNNTTKRQRRIGVYEINNTLQDQQEEGEVTIFKSVKLLRDNYLAMLEKTVSSFEKTPNKLDDSLLLPPPSGYCSSTGASDDERDKNWEEKTKVRRCGSSDSAMGHSDEDLEKKDLIYPHFVDSPYSPRGSVDHDNVPSKTLIEASVVPLPLDRKCSDCVSDIGDYQSDSRRQSCFTDDGEEQTRYRYWRTPSVVVSDYSDDIMGLTLEDIEYIRNSRKEASSSPESSLHSSCSNLNYCGSTISALESDYVLRKPFRKSSNSSTCSVWSDEENDTLVPPKNKEVSFVKR